MGGTIIEEQVVHDAGSTNEATRAQVEEIIRGAGFNPVIRDTYWNLRSDLELATA
jgi:2-iminoacetate synthase ThiH